MNLQLLLCLQPMLAQFPCFFRHISRLGGKIIQSPENNSQFFDLNPVYCSFLWKSREVAQIVRVFVFCSIRG